MAATQFDTAAARLSTVAAQLNTPAPQLLHHHHGSSHQVHGCSYLVASHACQQHFAAWLGASRTRQLRVPHKASAPGRIDHAHGLG